MKYYSSTDIKEITQQGITLKDGNIIDFNVCIANARAYFNNDTISCVAERNLFAKPPYFFFFSDKRIKIVFNQHKGLFAKNKNIKDFQHLQSVLQSLNINTYDLS